MQEEPEPAAEPLAQAAAEGKTLQEVAAELDAPAASAQPAPADVADASTSKPSHEARQEDSAAGLAAAQPQLAAPIADAPPPAAAAHAADPPAADETASVPPAQAADPAGTEPRVADTTAPLIDAVTAEAGPESASTAAAQDTVPSMDQQQAAEHLTSLADPEGGDTVLGGSEPMELVGPAIVAELAEEAVDYGDDDEEPSTTDAAAKPGDAAVSLQGNG